MSLWFVLSAHQFHPLRRVVNKHLGFLDLIDEVFRASEKIILVQRTSAVSLNRQAALADCNGRLRLSQVCTKKFSPR